MGKIMNFIVGIIIIILGANYFLEFLNSLIPYAEILFPLILVVVGLFLIRESKVSLPPLEGRGPPRTKRKFSIILMGILISLFGIIRLLYLFDIVVPFTELFTQGSIPGFILILLGLIIIVMAFPRKKTPMIYSHEP